MLVLLLQKEGYQATAAASGTAALAELSQRPYDVVFSDIRMPGIDSLELLKVLRATHGTLPVIIMTGHGDVPLCRNRTARRDVASPGKMRPKQTFENCSFDQPVSMQDVGHITRPPLPPSGTGTYSDNYFVFSNIGRFPRLKFVYPKEFNANSSS